MGQRILVLDEDLADLLRDLLPRIADALERVEAPQPTTAGLTVQETAQQLRVSARLVESMVASGQINAVRFGRRVVVPRAEVDRIMAAGDPGPAVRRVG
jgi:excisionase family DNA binding protein